MGYLEVGDKGQFYQGEVVISSCRKFSEYCMVLDLVGFTEKCTVVMDSSDSFPFAHTIQDPTDFIFGDLKGPVRSPA